MAEAGSDIVVCLVEMKSMWEEEGYVQREITTDDSGNNAQLETLYSYSKGTLYTREEESGGMEPDRENNNLPVVSFGTFERDKAGWKNIHDILRKR